MKLLRFAVRLGKITLTFTLLGAAARVASELPEIQKWSLEFPNADRISLSCKPINIFTIVDFFDMAESLLPDCKLKNMLDDSAEQLVRVLLTLLSAHP